MYVAIMCIYIYIYIYTHTYTWTLLQPLYSCDGLRRETGQSLGPDRVNMNIYIYIYRERERYTYVM